ESGFGTGSGKLRVLGQESISGMNGLDPGTAGGVEDGRYVEVGVGRGRGADADGRVGFLHVQAPGLGIGIDGHGANTHAPAGADDATGNLAAVGDEERITRGDRQSCSLAHRGWRSVRRPISIPQTYAPLNHPR